MAKEQNPLDKSEGVKEDIKFVEPSTAAEPHYPFIGQQPSITLAPITFDQASTIDKSQEVWQ